MKEMAFADVKPRPDSYLMAVRGDDTGLTKCDFVVFWHNIRVMHSIIMKLFTGLGIVYKESDRQNACVCPMIGAAVHKI